MGRKGEKGEGRKSGKERGNGGGVAIVWLDL